MKLERSIIEKLAALKTSADRKPLILQGARQIGKTWALQMFGEQYFEHTAYFNFDETKELKNEFEKTKNPERLLGQQRRRKSRRRFAGNSECLFAGFFKTRFN
jgi:predicted AAA+ superfamily ATPase